MNKVIELTMDSSYLDWTVDMAIRDIFQNALDSQTSGFPMSIDYDKDSKSLSLKNDGAKIPLKTLLIGFSTKRGDQRMIGHFGEG